MMIVLSVRLIVSALVFIRAVNALAEPPEGG
jgi:hypothetical protein